MLNQYLTGLDLSGNRPNRPGFMVMGSQNARSQSLALRNRTHFSYMDTFKISELRAIASYKFIYFDQFVKAYKDCKRKYPDSTNTRTFFKLWGMAKNPPAEMVEKQQALEKNKKHDLYYLTLQAIIFNSHLWVEAESCSKGLSGMQSIMIGMDNQSYFQTIRGIAKDFYKEAVKSHATLTVNERAFYQALMQNKTIDGFVHAPIFKTINQIVEKYLMQDEFPSPKRKRSC